MSYRSRRRTSACPVVCGKSEAVMPIFSTRCAEAELLRLTKGAQDRIADCHCSAVRM